jgi:hypothetical protein
MRSDEPFGFWRDPPSTRVRRPSACSKVDGVNVSAVRLQIEYLLAACPHSTLHFPTTAFCEGFAGAHGKPAGQRRKSYEATRHKTGGCSVPKRDA